MRAVQAAEDGHDGRRPLVVADLAACRRERPDHVLALGERHPRRPRREYVAWFKQERPHQGIGQATPERAPRAMGDRAAPVRAVPVLGGLHHAYQRAT
jgi:hypothetical protein